jgi:hypothetical protein
LFPDAPRSRGRDHIASVKAGAGQGVQAAARARFDHNLPLQRRYGLAKGCEIG